MRFRGLFASRVLLVLVLATSSSACTMASPPRATACEAGERMLFRVGSDVLSVPAVARPAFEGEPLVVARGPVETCLSEIPRLKAVAISGRGLIALAARTPSDADALRRAGVIEIREGAMPESADVAYRKDGDLLVSEPDGKRRFHILRPASRGAGRLVGRCSGYGPTEAPPSGLCTVFSSIDGGNHIRTMQRFNDPATLSLSEGVAAAERVANSLRFQPSTGAE